MPHIYFSRPGRLGNNIIQYMAAKLVSKIWGHTLVPYKAMLTDPYEITDTNEGPYSFSWSWFREAVRESSPWLQGHPLSDRDIYLNGYFQTDDIYLFERAWLRSLFTKENEDLLGYGLRVCDLMRAEGVACEGLVLHLRLDDFQECKQVLHPKVFLRHIRRLNLPLNIVIQKATKKEEEFYLALFDAHDPQVLSSDRLTDHATLRRAKKLMTSNSTFAWTAAFLGEAEQRWIAPLTNMRQVEPSDIVLELAYVDLSSYIREPEARCFSGEDFLTLCDYTVLSRKKKEYHKGLDTQVPVSRQLFLDEPWTAPTYLTSVAIYAGLVKESLEPICRYFEDVKLLLIHNGDDEPVYEDLRIFLNKYPDAHIYAQNSSLNHSRIHTLPMGIQNRMWRNMEIARIFHVEKENLVFVSYMNYTHPSRAQLIKGLLKFGFPGLHILPKSSQDIYLWRMAESMYTACPPGHAHDTHRLWESLYCFSVPIVLDTPFIQALLRSCPRLPLHRVADFDRLEPPPCTDLTHHSVYLYLDYWRELFATY